MHVVGVHMYMHAYRVQRLALGVFLNKSLSYFFEVGFTTELEPHWLAKMTCQ